MATGPVGSSPVTSGPTTAPGAPFGVPIAVTDQTASWSAAVDTVAVLDAAGNVAYREVESLGDGLAPGAVAAVDPLLGLQIISRQLNDLLELSSILLAALRRRRIAGELCR